MSAVTPAHAEPPSRRQPTAGLIIIGNEVLSAKVADANTPLLIQRVSEAGLRVGEVAIVPDDIDRIAEVVRGFAARFDLVVTTGGVGPTHDDCTWKAVAQAFGLPMELHGGLIARIEAKVGHALSAEQQRLAWLPAGTQIDASDGRWPLLHYGNVHVLPGVPSMVASRIGQILERFRQARPQLATVYFSADEWSHVAQIDAVVAEFADLDIGSYPIFGDADHRLQITLEGFDRERVQAAAEQLIQTLGRQHLVRVVWREDPHAEVTT